MKRFYSRFRVSLLTFTIGSAGVFMINNSPGFESGIAVNLPQANSASVFEVVTKRKWKGFEETGRGCGGRNLYGGEGAATTYQNADFESVSVSFSGHDKSTELKHEIKLRISESSKVLENNEEERLEKKRIVLENFRDNEKWFDVIAFETPKSIKVKTARRLELIDDFENWEIFRDRQLKKQPAINP